MKVVLMQTVPRLGDPGAVVDVAAGYARNFLLPKRMAMKATPGNLKIIENLQKKEESEQAKERQEAEVLAQQLTSSPLDLVHRAGDTDTLYGAVTSAEIAFALEEKGFTIDRRSILMDEPLKSLGSYIVPIKLHTSVTAQLTVNVIRDEL